MGRNLRPLSIDRILLLSLLLMMGLSGSRFLWANQKLCMKDGTYQIVRSYEVQGDRVRYYSIERDEWEEVPTDLVDFDATKRAVEDAKATREKQLEEARELEKQRFFQAPSRGLEVAPGVRLSGSDGVFTLDGQRLVRLAVSEGEELTDKKRAAMVLAVPLPVVKSRSFVVLDGPKSAIRLTDPWPAFYVQSSDGLGERLELVQLQDGKRSRVVEDVDVGRGKSAKPTEERTMISIERKQLGPNVYMLKPLKPLAEGEYALGEVVDDKLSLYVYDFGYDKWVTVK